MAKKETPENKTPLRLMQEIANLREQRKALVEKNRETRKTIYNLSKSIEAKLDELSTLI